MGRGEGHVKDMVGIASLIIMGGGGGNDDQLYIWLIASVLDMKQHANHYVTLKQKQETSNQFVAVRIYAQYFGSGVNVFLAYSKCLSFY
jgi:hypothetical protein